VTTSHATSSKARSRNRNALKHHGWEETRQTVARPLEARSASTTSSGNGAPPGKEQGKAAIQRKEASGSNTSLNLQQQPRMTASEQWKQFHDRERDEPRADSQESDEPWRPAPGQTHRQQTTRLKEASMKTSSNGCKNARAEHNPGTGVQTLGREWTWQAAHSCALASLPPLLGGPLCEKGFFYIYIRSLQNLGILRVSETYCYHVDNFVT